MARKAEKLRFQTSARRGPEYRTWFRGEHVNALPTDARLFRPGGVEKYAPQGWAPERPDWPSYEPVTDVFAGCMKHDRRHPEDAVLDYSMMLFERVRCADCALTEAEMTGGFVRAGAAAGLFPSILGRVVEERRARRLRKVLHREEMLANPAADRAPRAMPEGLANAWASDSMAKISPDGLESPDSETSS